ncbi:unnamed protein product [Rhizophagus irregularis]|uniref:Uncharacterized protein n=1 Tax=Rhizophagus irregularis TaxID=588596 RepID=A0A915YY53_9GLOM|nr:unnamed protein product [Rhizophagus irregularis]
MVKNLKNYNDLLLKAIRPRPEQFALQAKYVFEFRVIKDQNLTKQQIILMITLISTAFNHYTTSYHLIACILMSIGHESGPALIKVSRFVSRHQGLILKILTDISPVNLLVSPNVEVKDNVILSIGIVHKMFRIFYFLGVKLEVIDKKPKLSICINYVHTSIDILNHHMQNFRRISIKLEKGDNIEEILSGLRNKDVDNLGALQ